MSNSQFLTVFLIIAFSCSAWSYDCSNVTRIESEGLLNRLMNVSFPAPHNFSGEWVMDIETDVEYTFLGGWGIWVRNNPSKGKASFRSRSDNLTIAEGDIVTFRFRISWFTGEPKPEVISMIWDGDQLCTDDGKSVNEIKATRARRTSQNQHIGRGMRLPVN